MRDGERIAGCIRVCRFAETRENEHGNEYLVLAALCLVSDLRRMGLQSMETQPRMGTIRRLAGDVHPDRTARAS
jgi:hypothetical protein